MAFCSAFHVFSVLAFSLTGSFVELDNAAICPTTTEIGQKTTYVMKKCNSNIKEYYARNQNDNQRDTYCTGMKILMNCARTWTDKFEERFHCTSEMLREWLFVTLQYVVISRKLDICNYDTQRLKNLINNLGFENNTNFQGKSIVFVQFSDRKTKNCAKEMHEKCARHLIKETNLCTGVSEFVSCYDGKVKGFLNDDKPCDDLAEAPEISRKFSTLINEFSRDLIGKYQNTLNQEEMCHVDANEVDLDRYNHD